ncbi:hypothetical protein R9C00_11675 [Flammeovirgaceae bacterium SG7u.111]|nr:hypothetical protein [Flammeovirgaceae bacterium SG7u.132]WPO38112.1 hypothetical protein R9C00_11675 [Flammeovirgaceae bacterium SG7u.111]
MNYLLFGGARDTGKSESVYNLANHLVRNLSYSVRSGNLPNSYAEFQCIIEKNDNVILIQSYTDLVQNIKSLKGIFNSNPDITHIITANRNEGDYMRQRFRNIMNITSNDYVFEIPLGKVISGNTREINIKWYLKGILKVAIGISNQSPFSF